MGARLPTRTVAWTNFSTLHLGQHDHFVVAIDDSKIGGLAALVAQPAQEGHAGREENALAGESRADRKRLAADMPDAFGPVELHEAALFERDQQPIGGGRRQTRTGNQIAEAAPVLVLAQGFKQGHGAVDGLDIAGAGGGGSGRSGSFYRSWSNFAFFRGVTAWAGRHALCR